MMGSVLPVKRPPHSLATPSAMVTCTSVINFKRDECRGLSFANYGFSRTTVETTVKEEDWMEYFPSFCYWLVKEGQQGNGGLLPRHPSLLRHPCDGGNLSIHLLVGKCHPPPSTTQSDRQTDGGQSQQLTDWLTDGRTTKWRTDD